MLVVHWEYYMYQQDDYFGKENFGFFRYILINDLDFNRKQQNLHWTDEVGYESLIVTTTSQI